MGRKDGANHQAGALHAEVRGAMSEIQSYARSHGGEIDLVSVSDDGEVSVRFLGACDGCPVSDLTLKLGVEDRLKALVPGVTKVIQVES